MMVRITSQLYHPRAYDAAIVYCPVSYIDCMQELMRVGKTTCYCITIRGKDYYVEQVEFDRVQSLVFQEEEG